LQQVTKKEIQTTFRATTDRSVFDWPELVPVQQAMVVASNSAFSLTFPALASVSLVP
jgi:hypothetical protein